MWFDFCHQKTFSAQVFFFFFFRNKKTSSFPPKRIQVSKFPHLPFRTPRPWRTWYLEQQIFSDEMMWLQWLTTGMLSVTVVIPATSDSILIDTSHLCFLLNLRCDMQGVYSDSFSWDKVCFVPWTRNLSGSLNPQSHCLLLISSLPTSCKAANETIESQGNRDAGVKLLNFPGLRCQKRFGRCSYLNSNWMTWTWLVST